VVCVYDKFYSMLRSKQFIEYTMLSLLRPFFHYLDLGVRVRLRGRTLLENDG
jgi:hypothetical protein